MQKFACKLHKFVRVCIVFVFYWIVFVSIYTKHETRNTKHDVFVYRVPNSNLQVLKQYRVRISENSIIKLFRGLINSRNNPSIIRIRIESAFR